MWPPAGTNAISKMVLEHIPDAINSVDSAPSSALFREERFSCLSFLVWETKHKQQMEFFNLTNGQT